MANKMIRDGEFIRDRSGGVVTSLGSDEERTKCYAVIVECGHCGRGYYIPIMFTTRASNIQNAIKDIKMTPKVKREKVNCVLDAFEITELEKFTIDALNDHDDYLLGYVEKDSGKMKERRIASFINEDESVRTADEYHYYDVLARAFAPRYVGSDLIVPTRINRKELVDEFMKVGAIRYGIKREDPFFPMLYFLERGEDNELGIKLDGNILTCDDIDKKKIVESIFTNKTILNKSGKRTFVPKSKYFLNFNVSRANNLFNILHNIFKTEIFKETDSEYNDNISIESKETIMKLIYKNLKVGKSIASQFAEYLVRLEMHMLLESQKPWFVIKNNNKIKDCFNTDDEAGIQNKTAFVEISSGDYEEMKAFLTKFKNLYNNDFSDPEEKDNKNNDK